MAFKVSDIVSAFKGYKAYIGGQRIMPKDGKKDNRAIAVAYPDPRAKLVFLVLA